MRALWMVMALVGCADDPCGSASETRDSFHEMPIFSGCFEVSVCEDGSFDWSEPQSESRIDWQFDASGNNTYGIHHDDIVTRGGCTSHWWGVRRPECTDRRITSECLMPVYDAEMECEADHWSPRSADTLAEADATATCVASASCQTVDGVELEARLYPPIPGDFVDVLFQAVVYIDLFEASTGERYSAVTIVGQTDIVTTCAEGGIQWDGPEVPECLQADYTLSSGCDVSVGVPDAIRAMVTAQ